MQYFKDKTPCQDLRIMQLAYQAKLQILQKIISSKVHNKLLGSMHNKPKQLKNTQKDVYRLRYLNIEIVEAFFIREEKKQQNNFYKKNKKKA